ncbi:hypothetical protein, partial [Klebsiella pneumoniae]
GCVGCLVGHLFMFLVGGKTPDQSVHLNLTTTYIPKVLSNMPGAGATLNQNTVINISGVSDPREAGKIVSESQGNVNARATQQLTRGPS